MSASQSVQLLKLKELDDKSVQLQKDRNYLKALTCMEQGLVLRQRLFGTDSQEVWTACKTVGELCNFLAMTHLRDGEFKMTEMLLKKAEILHQNDNKGKAVTYNNLACFYRRKGKLRSALAYLKKTLRIEAMLDDVENPGDTHLNMCAVLSELGRHQQALEHARLALIMLQDELLQPADDDLDTPIPPARCSVLAIAYHNVGVENEFLKNYKQAVDAYEKGLDLGEEHLGPQHFVCITLRNSLNAVRSVARKAKKGSSTARSSGRTPF